MKTRIIPLVLALIASHSALAHEQEQPVSLFNFEVSSVRDVKNDIMQVSLYAEDTDVNASSLAQRNTDLINQALKLVTQANNGIAEQDQIIATSGQRQITPIYDDKSRLVIAGWKERASLHLRSNDFSKLSGVIPELQGMLKMSSLSFAVSEPLREAEQERLEIDLTQKLNKKASLFTKQLGFDDFEISQIHLSSTGFARPMHQEPMLMRATMSDSAQEMEVAAGSSAIQASATVSIKLLKEPN
jgi:predicted secreted protein